MTDAEAAAFDQKIKAADEEQGHRVSLRWGDEQIAVIKAAAAMFGVPYQTYIKTVLYRQAVTDLNGLQLNTMSGTLKPIFFDQATIGPTHHVSVHMPKQQT